MSERDPLDLVEALGDSVVDPDPIFARELLAELLGDGVAPTAESVKGSPSPPPDAPVLIEIKK